MSTAKEKRRAGIRQSILEAAHSLMVERGLDAFSLRELARQLDYSPAGLYEYFGSKREIVDAIRREGEAQLERRLARVDPGPDSGAHLIALVRVSLRFAAANPVVFQLLRGRPDRPAPESIPAALHSAAATGVRRHTWHLPAGQTAGDLTLTIWALVHGLAALWPGEAAADAAALEAAGERAVALLQAGLERP